MQTLNEIFSAFKLTQSDVNRLSDEAKLAAIGLGRNDANIELPSETWDLFDKISEKVWDSSMAVAEKISLGFQLYETFPHYYHFLVPFYRAVSGKEVVDPDEKETIWKQLIKYLGSESHYADPVSYVLWVEFFEDETTVRDTWQGLVTNCSYKKLLLRLLEVAGPVPFDLKETHYYALLAEEENHQLIFNSLLHSAFEVYGQIDIKKAADILAKLKIDTNTENYKLLEEKLKKEQPVKFKPK